MSATKPFPRDAMGVAHKPIDPADARIVSLVPSITELLFSLNLGDHIVARTQFCVHPEGKVDALPSVGGTKKIKMDRLRALEPTHVILNVDENTKELAETLRTFVPNLVVTHPLQPRDNLDLFRMLGGMFDRGERAEALCQDFEIALRAVMTFAPRLTDQRVLYLIWKDPWMTISPNTYIARMLELVRWRPVSTDTRVRYPTVQMTKKLLDGVDIVLFSSEPFKFTEDHISEFREKFKLPRKIMRMIDGEMVSWYGSRAIQGLNYLRQAATETK
jgi:ABC-type Fe3+-hydroxamate transport system substrate-binding protein